jgi:CMP-N-acetylneuraminic acid synthetase
LFRNNTILAIIPARGGSKRLPGKNIMPIAKKPLIAWTIDEALKSRYLDRTILSSDCPEIIRTAEKYGCEVPFIRPHRLSGDNSTSADVVLHAISSLDMSYDYVVLLQPTCPFRTVKHIDKCIEKCIIEKANTLITVYKTGENPLWCWENHKNRLSDKFRRNLSSFNGPFYIENGAVMIVKTKWFIKNKIFMASGTSFFEMKKEESVDIDDMLEFKIAEFLLKDREKNKGVLCQTRLK